MTIPTFPSLQGMEYPVKRSPVWSNIRQESISGKRAVNQQWSYPRYKYEVSFSWLSSLAAIADYQTLLGFFNELGAGAGLFKFIDPDDNTATAQSIGTGDGTTRTFQLVGSFGGFAQPVFYASAVNHAYVNGTDVVGTCSYADPGLLTFASAPAMGATVTWSGTYGFMCRFDDDTIDFSNFASGFYSLSKLAFSTEKF